MHNVYVPELIFGHLLTSSNYDDSIKKTTGGRNGYGAKLTNIFSSEFRIVAADANWIYTQVFSNNMCDKTAPTLVENKEGKQFTRIEFTPDLKRFHMNDLDDDILALMRKRVFDIAAITQKVRVSFNGKRIPIQSFKEYAGMYLPENYPCRIFHQQQDRWEFCVTVSDGQFEQVSFVNAINTIKGGPHVKYIADQIVSFVLFSFFFLFLLITTN